MGAMHIQWLHVPSRPIVGVLWWLWSVLWAGSSGVGVGDALGQGVRPGRLGWWDLDASRLQAGNRALGLGCWGSMLGFLWGTVRLVAVLLVPVLSGT